ncbi:MAG: hypothetical protein KAR06_10735 [Deltaproteobacteria bacterium]|nr:hypothetical protein [Deltaproteobacteria bacterium]
MATSKKPKTGKKPAAKKKTAKKSALGKAGGSLVLTKAMRSRISDNLTPPPTPPTNEAPKPIEAKFDPKVIAERIWSELLQTDETGSFEVKFYLSSGKEFALRGDKEGFGTIQALEPFSEVHERLLEAHHNEVVRIEIYSDLKGLNFTDYNDFLEWLEL